ncbi:GerMN domain-containing protein [Crassaminicella thermophila]|uniref:GerMN domain-containing protein n=1 Tax=Crassaminicella thermophila TaxID=2599308 RepID=A0A5C0SDW9_CRATE|nr:GerMN domain-containing protein [Crassaminicella thermophila]QEK12481.1 GerMN domain-containing protein [Crassaminicella thermophila]
MRKSIMICLCILLLTSMFVTGCNKKEENIQKPMNTVKEERNENKEEKTIDYVLFLRHKDKPFLFDEAYSIKANDEKLKGMSIEEFVMKELIDFEGFGEYINAIPKGTKLLSVKKDGETVIVDLSKEFVEGLKKNKEDTYLTLASIVNTLTILPGNEKVQFMIEGEILDKINDVDTSKPFEYIQGLYPDK